MRPKAIVRNLAYLPRRKRPLARDFLVTVSRYSNVRLRLQSEAETNQSTKQTTLSSLEKVKLKRIYLRLPIQDNLSLGMPKILHEHWQKLFVPISSGVMQWCFQSLRIKTHDQSCWAIVMTRGEHKRRRRLQLQVSQYREGYNVQVSREKTELLERTLCSTKSLQQTFG